MSGINLNDTVDNTKNKNNTVKNTYTEITVFRKLWDNPLQQAQSSLNIEFHEILHFMNLVSIPSPISS